MRIQHVLVALALTGGLALAQDKVTLSNGDVLTGKVTTMTDGKLTIASPVLGDVVVEMAKISSIATAEPVQLLTTSGDLLRRRIRSIESGAMLFDGEGQQPLSGVAAINPPADPPPKWTGAFKVGAGLTSGNTERRNIGASFDAELRREDDRVSADAAWDYAEDKQPGSTNWNLTQRRAGGGLKYDRFLSECTYALVTTRVLGDTLADIDLRYTVGVGLGRQILEGDDTSLLAELGVSYFKESYRSGAPKNDYLSARVAYKLRHKFNDQTRLIHGVEAFPSLEDSQDVYLQSTTEVQTNLSDSMIGSLAWIWDYDNTPSPGRDRSDHRVLLSVGWTF
ncbi:MAG: YdiY family protein [Planctomycetota bacterium]